MRTKNKNGFTLIELMVVIAVIALLASVVLVSLNSARQKARNADRNATAVQLIKAFNLELNDNKGVLPDTGGAWVCLSATCYGGWNIFSASPAVDALLAPEMASKPVDPSDGGARGYGGFIYNSSWGAGTAWDGTVYPTGSYIIYMMETSDTKGCGAAGFWWTFVNNSVECAAQIH